MIKHNRTTGETLCDYCQYGDAKFSVTIFIRTLGRDCMFFLCKDCLEGINNGETVAISGAADSGRFRDLHGCELPPKI